MSEAIRGDKTNTASASKFQDHIQVSPENAFVGGPRSNGAIEIRIKQIQ